MKNSIILIILTLFANVVFAKQPKIVTSITPVASILSMMTEGAAEVVAIDNSAGCPHHYHMRPSDKDKVLSSDMLIYIDDQFDGFANRIFEGSKDRIIKISDLKSINFMDDSGKKNWHFWLSLPNILAMQKEVTKILLKEFPDLKKVIMEKEESVRSKISVLERLKRNELQFDGELVVLSDSLEHFFEGVDMKITKLYQKSNASLKDLEDLEYILNTNSLQCIVIDRTQNPDTYKRFNKKIIQLDSENWPLSSNPSENKDLFYHKYEDMILQLKNCH